jgi:outer membrane lipoprotein-sorting protein
MSMRLTALFTLFLTLAPLTKAEVPVIKPDSDLDSVLDALDARGRDLKDFTADVAIHSTDARTGEDSAQIGKVTFQDKGNGASRIRVSFDAKKTEGADGKQVTQKQRLDYVLDGGWLTDRDYQKKLEVKRQVLKPGQKMNLLKLGEGPFPMPIGQPKEDVKKLFTTTKVLPTKDDPADTAHVRLVPVPNTQFAKRFKQIDVYVDTKTNMPRRIDTIERSGNQTKSTDLTNVKINGGVKDEDFALESIDNAGWNRREEPFE